MLNGVLDGVPDSAFPTETYPTHLAVPEFTDFRRLMGGEDSAPGYLAALQDQRTLDEHIDAAAALLGPKLLEPLAEQLVRKGVEEFCLVPLGVLGLLPLHALCWQ